MSMREQLYRELGFINNVPITEANRKAILEENDGVYPDDVREVQGAPGKYIRVVKIAETDQELLELAILKQAADTKKIRKMLSLFYYIAIAGLIFFLLPLLSDFLDLIF